MKVMKMNMKLNFTFFITLIGLNTSIALGTENTRARVVTQQVIDKANKDKETAGSKLYNNCNTLNQFNCRNLNTTSQLIGVTKAASEAVGAVTTAVQSYSAQQNVIQQGTQASALEQTAALQRGAANRQLMMSAAMGAGAAISQWQLQQQQTKMQNLEKAYQAQGGGVTRQRVAITAAAYEQSKAEQTQAIENGRAVSQYAMQEALKQGILGAGNRAQANALQKNADTLKQAENAANIPLTPTLPTDTTPTDSSGGLTDTGVNGLGTAAADPLADPNLAGPAAGKFNAGGANAPVAGAGGFSGGGAQTQANTGAAKEDAGASAADNSGNKSIYAPGGGGGSSGGLGGGKGDNSLADMMKNLLNLNDPAAAPGAPTSILNAGEGADRGPASDGAFLAQNVSLFKRISERTAFKVQTGDVGEVAAQ